jgi:hypothetical protein
MHRSPTRGSGPHLQRSMRFGIFTRTPMWAMGTPLARSRPRAPAPLLRRLGGRFARGRMLDRLHVDRHGRRAAPRGGPAQGGPLGEVLGGVGRRPERLLPLLYDLVHRPERSQVPAAARGPIGRGAGEGRHGRPRLPRRRGVDGRPECRARHWANVRGQVPHEAHRASGASAVSERRPRLAAA